MGRQVSAKTEIELWQDLIEGQEEYVHSLSRLDNIVLNAAPMAAIDERAFEEAAKVRRAAYAKYRQAMEDLSAFHRK